MSTLKQNFFYFFYYLLQPVQVEQLCAWLYLLRGVLQVEQLFAPLPEKTGKLIPDLSEQLSYY
jgi:hypothetical protein